jgi:hypothetical protein
VLRSGHVRQVHLPVEGGGHLYARYLRVMMRRIFPTASYAYRATPSGEVTMLSRPRASYSYVICWLIGCVGKPVTNNKTGHTLARGDRSEGPWDLRVEWWRYLSQKPARSVTSSLPQAAERIK